MITEEIKEYVYNECKKPGNSLGIAFFNQHILKVVEYSKMLACNLSADLEIVELSAYLHDVAAIQNIAFLPEFSTLSAKIAGNILKEKNYPVEKIEKVMLSIQDHLTPIRIGAGSPEEVCLSNADAMSQITTPVYWLYFLFVIRRCTLEEGRAWLLKTVEYHWNSLIQPAKEIIEKEYYLTRSILSK